MRNLQFPNFYGETITLNRSKKEQQENYLRPGESNLCKVAIFTLWCVVSMYWI